MRLPVTRRAALVAGVATVAAVALAGCSAGQVAETALKKPSNMGVNADTADVSVAIRNLSVAYTGPDGIPGRRQRAARGGHVQPDHAEIMVTVTSRPAETPRRSRASSSGTMVGLVGGPSAPARDRGETPGQCGAVRGRAVRIGRAGRRAGRATGPDHPPGTRLRLLPPRRPQQLQVIGLTGRLVPGMSVNLVFEFSNGAAAADAAGTGRACRPVPASRAPGNEAENHEPE